MTAVSVSRQDTQNQPGGENLPVRTLSLCSEQLGQFMAYDYKGHAELLQVKRKSEKASCCICSFVIGSRSRSLTSDDDAGPSKPTCLGRVYARGAGGCMKTLGA